MLPCVLRTTMSLGCLRVDLMQYKNELCFAFRELLAYLASVLTLYDQGGVSPGLVLRKRISSEVLPPIKSAGCIKHFGRPNF